MRKTMQEIIKAVQAETGQDITTDVISAQDASTQQLLALCTSVCDELSQDYDWQEMLRTYTFTTVAGQATYSLPVDLRKMAGRTLWNTTTHREVAGAITNSQWSALKGNQNSYLTDPVFRMQADSITIFPTPTSAQTITFDYYSHYYIVDDGTHLYKRAFTSNSDAVVLDGRLITNALKLRWRTTKGFRSTAEALAFEASLEAAKSGNSPAPTLDITGGCADDIFDLNVPDSGYGL